MQIFWGKNVYFETVACGAFFPQKKKNRDQTNHTHSPKTDCLHDHMGVKVACVVAFFALASLSGQSAAVAADSAAQKKTPSPRALWTRPLREPKRTIRQLHTHVHHVPGEDVRIKSLCASLEIGILNLRRVQRALEFLARGRAIRQNGPDLETPKQGALRKLTLSNVVSVTLAIKVPFDVTPSNKTPGIKNTYSRLQPTPHNLKTMAFVGCKSSAMDVCC